MQKERKDNQFIKKPIYPGGSKAMRELIRKELKYPKEAFDAKVEGSVYLRYNIDYKGKVVSSKVLTSVGYGCDEEAQRIVSKFKFEVPKGPKKLKVKFHKTIRIHFRLPKEQIKKPPITSNQHGRSTQLTYSITPTRKEPEKKKPEKKSTNYTYTIKY
ncbi:MAG: energy transducer TonB [Saprospiraceae bacterium]|nr:energy transducer TonB [Saprospiraceae bacterium]